MSRLWKLMHLQRGNEHVSSEMRGNLKIRMIIIPIEMLSLVGWLCTGFVFVMNCILRVDGDVAPETRSYDGYRVAKRNYKTT